MDIVVMYVELDS